MVCMDVEGMMNIMLLNHRRYNIDSSEAKLTPNKMACSEAAQVKLIKNAHRYQNLLATRSSASFLFIILCFLIIANTRCDQVGSSNVHTPEMDKEQSLDEKATPVLTNKDPLSMLREIYLGHNSKVITMLPTGSDSVQKFHPNGRYGRRSVNTLAESSPNTHTELGKLRFNNDGSPEPPRTILRSFDNSLGARAFETNNKLGAINKYQQHQQAPANPRNELENNNNINSNSDLFTDPIPGVTNIEQELNKLLKCNFTGVSNLYWCDTGN